MTHRITTLWRYAEYRYAECRILFIIMLYVIMLKPMKGPNKLVFHTLSWKGLPGTNTLAYWALS